MAFYDVHEDYLWGYMRIRKRSKKILGVFKWLRRRYPLHEQIYLVLDNFSPHHCQLVFQCYKQNNVEFVLLPQILPSSIE